jgi:TonB family protein
MEPPKRYAKHSGPEGKAQGRGNPEIREAGKARVKELTSRSATSSMSAIDLFVGEIVKDVEKVTGQVTGLTKSGNSRFAGGRPGKRDADFNSLYSAVEGEGIGDALGDLWGPSGKAVLPTVQREGGAPGVSFQSVVEMESEGGLRSQESILQVIRRHMPGLRHLYNKHLKLHPGFRGKISVEFSLAPSGAVLALRVISTTTDVPDFDRAVLAQIGTWRFEPVKGRSNDMVTVPFTFSE